MKYLLIILLLLSSRSYSQTIEPIMSCVEYMPCRGNISLTYATKGKAECVAIESGLYSTVVGRYGEYRIDCSFEYNNLIIHLFPNPSSTYTELQIVHPFKTRNINYEITLYDVSGNRITTRTESEATLYDGLKLDVSSLADGAYFIKVSSWVYDKTFKFIIAK